MDNQNGCKAIVETYMPQIIEGIIADYGDPETICTNLGQCPWMSNKWVQMIQILVI